MGVHKPIQSLQVLCLPYHSTCDLDNWAAGSLMTLVTQCPLITSESFFPVSVLPVFWPSTLLERENNRAPIIGVILYPPIPSPGFCTGAHKCLEIRWN